MELMSQYECKIVYLKGSNNTAANALSRTNFGDHSSAEAERHAASPFAPEVDEDLVASIIRPPTSPWKCTHVLATTDHEPSPTPSRLSIHADEALLKAIRTGYKSDKWCTKLLHASSTPHGVKIRDGLIYITNRLVIPRVTAIRETLFHLAHDVLGHFSFDKSYGSLRTSFYWPGMRHDLETAYILACANCVCNKSPTKPLAGPLHPLPIPENRGDSVAIDFIGPLPKDGDDDCIITFTDHLGSDI